MKLDRMTVSFDDLIMFYLKKWKIFLMFMIILPLLFVAGTMIIGKEIVVPDSEEYLYYQEQVEYYEDYIDNSILLKIDPMEIPERTLYVSNITNHVLLKDYVQSTEIWDDFKSDVKAAYLSELISWQVTSNENLISIRVRHITQEECDKCIDYVIKQLEQFDSQLQIEKGAARVVSDKELSADNLYVYARLEVSNEKLESADAGYVIRVDMLSSALCGILTGALLATVVLFVRFYVISVRKNRDEYA